MEEIWKPIKDYEGLYEISNFGRVKRLSYISEGKIYGSKKSYPRNFGGGILKGSVCANGYKRVTLTKDGINRYFHIHRLVALSFIPNPDNLPLINHKDENRTNNKVENLEWCSFYYNNTYNGLRQRVAESRRKTLSYPIKMLTIAGDVVREFSSVRKAAEYMGTRWTTIYRAVKKERKTALGYVWERA